MRETREGGWVFSERARFGDLTGVLCAGNPMWSHRFRPGDVPSLRNLPRREARGVWPGRTARPAQAVPAHISSRVRAKVPTLSMYFPGAFYVGSAPETVTHRASHSGKRCLLTPVYQSQHEWESHARAPDRAPASPASDRPRVNSPVFRESSVW